jgi:outer membrane protein OmpA-like peptidoglycan-associated protein
MRVASDEREHRRGLVLGLTMAEVLLLLLFLLLLALAAKLMHQAKDLAKANDVIQTLEPVIKEVAGKEVTPQTVQALARDLASVPELRRENEKLTAALAEASKRADAFKQLEARAREINPDDPPAALRRSLELLADANTGRLKERLEALSKLEELAKTVDPDAIPQKTIESALASIQAARQHGDDAKMGGQVRERVAVLRETEHKLNDRLNAAFGPKLRDWGAEIDPASLILRFQRPDVLFETGSATLRPEFKKILNELFPEYIRILYEFRSDLEEVRIEGHTSSEWSSQTSDMQAYFLNMALSQDRTRAVLEYGLTETNLPPEHVTWARKLITANGLSSSRPREVNGEENREASRRVEFRVLTRAKEQLLKIVDPGNQ